MHRAFRLQFNEKINPEFVKIGEDLFKDDRLFINRNLSKYLVDDGSIDAAAIKLDWFQEVKANVFISHSHDDRDKALNLAGYLQHHFKIRAFVDSSIWEDSQELQRKIDNKYSWIDSKKEYYSYDAVSASTSHVHMMLSTSIAKMIDQTECFFFLESNASLSSRDAVKVSTASPWIYFELETARSVRIRPREEHREMVKVAKTENFSTRKLQVTYPVNFDRLTLITEKRRGEWESEANGTKTGPEALDVLYALTPSEQDTKLLRS